MDALCHPCLEMNEKYNTIPLLFMFIYRMLLPDSLLSKQVGKSLPFEFAVGLNGRIWINGRSTQETIEIVRRISGAEL